MLRPQQHDQHLSEHPTQRDRGHNVAQRDEQCDNVERSANAVGVCNVGGEGEEHEHKDVAEDGDAEHGGGELWGEG